jgi:hypothetical protein
MRARAGRLAELLRQANGLENSVALFDEIDKRRFRSSAK